MTRCVIFILEDMNGHQEESNLGMVDEATIESAIEMHKAFIKVCGWKSEYTYRFEFRESSLGVLQQAEQKTSIH